MAEQSGNTCDLDDVTLYHWTHCDHYERDAEICCRSLCHFLARPVCGKCEELMHSHCRPWLPHSLTFDLVPCCRPYECDCLWAVRTTWCKETRSKWVLHLSIPWSLITCSDLFSFSIVDIFRFCNFIIWFQWKRLVSHYNIYACTQAKKWQCSNKRLFTFLKCGCPT